MMVRRQLLWSGAPRQTTAVDPAPRRLHRPFDEAPRCRKVERRDRERTQRGNKMDVDVCRDRLQLMPELPGKSHRPRDRQKGALTALRTDQGGKH
jgi:hypothetical protein